MDSAISLCLIGFAGLLISAAATPLIRRLALALNLVDKPDGHRKLHERAIPLGGGAAVLFALCLTLLLVHLVPTPWQLTITYSTRYLGALFGATAVVVIAGLADDRIGLRGRHKLLAQFVAAGILVGSGLLIRNVQVFGWQFDLGLLAVPLTLLWLVGAMNALNLIDGIDGLATIVGIVLSLTIATMAALNHRFTEAVVMTAFSGSLLGFIAYNRPPAKIYLGDAGSMLIGLIVGAMAIQGSLKGPATVALAAPLAIWTIPLLDTSAAILRRKLTGRSIYTTDRGHLHHRLLERFGGSTGRTLLWIGAACAATSVGTLVSVFLKNDLFAVLTSLAVVAIFVATRMFGHVELQLLGSRTKTLLLSLVSLRTPSPEPRKGRQSSFRLQGTRGWDLLWNSLLESTEKLNLSGMNLDVNVPAAHEGYHASWRSIHWSDSSELWRAEIPLCAGQQIIGRLTISGERDGGSVCETIERLMDLLSPFEAQLMELAQQDDHPHGPPPALSAQGSQREI